MSDNNVAYLLEKLYSIDKDLGGKAKEGFFSIEFSFKNAIILLFFEIFKRNPERKTMNSTL
jgi:hypothetical protein